MGRVYDALRRSGTDGSAVVFEPQPDYRGEGRTHRLIPSAQQIEEELFSVSSILNRAEEAVNSSAFTAHTAYATSGTALPAGQSSGAVGATLDAARPARVSSLVSYDVDATRVEPHLVA